LGLLWPQPPLRLLVFAIPLALYFLKTYWDKKQIRTLLFITSCLLLIGLVFTFSIGAMLALAISFLSAIMIFGINIPLKKIVFVVFLVLTFFGLSSFYFFSTNKGIETLDFQKNPYNNISNRLIYWQKAYENFLRYPLLGSGPDTFQKVNSETQPFSTYAHNYFIQMLSDAGIFGFFTFSALICLIFSNGYNILKTKLGNRNLLIYMSIFISLLSSVLFASIDVDWHLPTVFFIFWIFAGLSTSYAK